MPAGAGSNGPHQGIRPDHRAYLAGLGVDADNALHIHRADQKRQARGEPRSAQVIWEESARRWEHAQRAEAIAIRTRYHRGQAARLRATLGSLVAHHEAERYEAMGRGAA